MSSHDLDSSSSRSSNGVLPNDSRLFPASARPGTSATFCAVNAAYSMPNPSILWRPRAMEADNHAGSDPVLLGGRREVVRPRLLVQRGHPWVETTATAATASSAAADPTEEVPTAAAPLLGSASTKRGLGATGLDRGKHDELLRVGKRQKQRFPPVSRATAAGAVNNVGASLPPLTLMAPRPPSPMTVGRKRNQHQTAPHEGWRPAKIRADGTNEREEDRTTSSSSSTGKRVAGRESEREKDGGGHDARPQYLTTAWQTVGGGSSLERSLTSSSSSSSSSSSLASAAGAVPPAIEKRRGREIFSAEPTHGQLPDTAAEPVSGRGCAFFGTAAGVPLPQPERSTVPAAISPITSRVPLSSVIGGRNIGDVQGPCSPPRPGTCIIRNFSSTNTSSGSSSVGTSRSSITSCNSNIVSSGSLTSVQRGDVGNNGQTAAERKERNLFDTESVAATATIPTGGKGEQQQQQQQHQLAQASVCPAFQRDWSQRQALKSAQSTGLAARQRLAEATAARRAVHEKLQACRSSLLQPATRELQRTQEAAQEHRSNHFIPADKGARRAREAGRAAEHACVAAGRRARDAKAEHHAAKMAVLFPALLSEWHEYAAMLEAERRTRAEAAAAARAAEGAWRRMGEARAAAMRADEAFREQADTQALLDNRSATVKQTYAAARKKCESLVSHLAAAGQREKAARFVYETAKNRFVEVRREVFAVTARTERAHGTSGISVAQRPTEKKGETRSVACAATAVGGAGDRGDGGGARGGIRGAGGAGGKGEDTRIIEGISLSSTAAGTKRAASAMGQAGVVGEGQEEEGRAKKRANVGPPG